jgi:hypothetical protein
VVVVDDDVQNIVRDIRALSERLHVYYNPQSGGFDIVEHCLDGTERLVFSVDELDQRVVHRLHLADHWRGQETPDHVIGEDEDIIARIDAENEALERASREQARDKIRDAGERLAWALDAVRDHHSVGGHIRVSKDIRG